MPTLQAYAMSLSQLQCWLALFCPARLVSGSFPGHCRCAIQALQSQYSDLQVQCLASISTQRLGTVVPDISLSADRIACSNCTAAALCASPAGCQPVGSGCAPEILAYLYTYIQYGGAALLGEVKQTGHGCR